MASSAGPDSAPDLGEDNARSVVASPADKGISTRPDHQTTPKRPTSGSQPPAKAMPTKTSMLKSTHEDQDPGEAYYASHRKQVMRFFTELYQVTLNRDRPAGDHKDTDDEANLDNLDFMLHKWIMSSEHHLLICFLSSALYTYQDMMRYETGSEKRRDPSYTMELVQRRILEYWAILEPEASGKRALQVRVKFSGQHSPSDIWDRLRLGEHPILKRGEAARARQEATRDKHAEETSAPSGKSANMSTNNNDPDMKRMVKEVQRDGRSLKKRCEDILNLLELIGSRELREDGDPSDPLFKALGIVVFRAAGLADDIVGRLFAKQWRFEKVHDSFPDLQPRIQSELEKIEGKYEAVEDDNDVYYDIFKLRAEAVARAWAFKKPSNGKTEAGSKRSGKSKVSKSEEKVFDSEDEAAEGDNGKNGNDDRTQDAPGNVSE